MSSLQKAKHSRVKVGSEIEFRDAQFRSQQVNTENNDKVTLSLWKDNDPIFDIHFLLNRMKEEGRKNSQDGFLKFFQ